MMLDVETSAAETVTDRKGSGLPQAIIDFGALSFFVGIGIFAVNRWEAKRSRWNDQIADNRCPWDSYPIVHPEDQDPLWYCTHRPTQHNADRKRTFFLF